MEVCTQCGSREVQGQAWVDLNTGIVIEWMEEEDNWCNNCNERVNTEFIEENHNEI